jgi:hypothetical protein
MACSWGGTNGYVQVWTESERQKIKSDKNEGNKEKSISFWPGGGGMMDVSVEPEDCYTIVGSWSGWSKIEVMESEGDGKYGFTVTLGDNRWEMFQIMLDGDSTKTLHPNKDKAPKATAAYGPEEMGPESAWMIDGRAPLPSGEEESAEIVQSEAQTTETLELFYDPLYIGEGAKAPTAKKATPPEAALPGTRFRIELNEVGKWRYVSWQKIEDSSRFVDTFAREDIKSVIRGTYYLNMGGELKEMTADSQDDSVHTAEVRLTRDGIAGGSFHILRNGDPWQTFYPAERSAKKDSEIFGPDEGYYAGYWLLDGLVGDAFKVTFERRLDKSGVETRKVSWTLVEAKDFREETYKRK